MKKLLIHCALVCAASLPLQGCMSSWAQMQGGGPSHANDSMFSGLLTKRVADDRATAQVGIVNHTGNYIYSASLSGDEIPGSSGGNMARWGAGGADVCCTSIPRIWHPGIKVLVRWNMPIGVIDDPKEKIVEIEKYDEPGSIYLHFFPNDEVRVVVSNAAGYSKKHPIPRTPKPENSTTER
jgi:hypothetical protein